MWSRELIPVFVRPNDAGPVRTVREALGLLLDVGELALAVRIALGQIAQRDRNRLVVPGGEDGLVCGEVRDEGAQRGGVVPGCRIGADAFR
jgi:hypothetical protein